MTIFQPANEQLGYYFHPPSETNAIGHAQLDAVIRPAPTGEHFDPESFQCPVATDGGVSRLHITQPWTQETAYRVCVGEVVIESARHDQITAFTFGGALRLEADSRRILCQLASPAPLLQHTHQTAALEEHLIEEVQILFAERRAAQDDEAFERKLAAADPLQLYHACLVTLNEKFANFPAVDEPHRRFKHFLRNAVQALADEVVPALADLL